MTTRKKLYCPFCKSNRPLWKAGSRITVTRSSGMVEKQRYQCPHCHRITVNPRMKPRPKSGRTGG